MEIITKKSILADTVERGRKQGMCVGFVPTMGALHEGHLSLVHQSKRETDLTVVSIFVNPTQFNDPEDLKRYPRTPEKDIRMLEEAGCDLLFLPETEEMYPREDLRRFDFGLLDTVMEGAKRKGHFNGVAQIVSKLFDVVRPHKAYFGIKDFQQVAVIREMVRQLALPVEIVACPIIREPDGLALSSRNMLLTPECRREAPLIWQTLQAAVQKAKTGRIPEVKQWVIDTIDASPLLRTDYFEIVSEQSLLPVDRWTGDDAIVGCIAVYAGNIRLIDNILFSRN